METINLKKIIDFNNKIFIKNKFISKKIILCEFSKNSSNHISFSYLVNILKKKYRSSCVAYQDIESLGFFSKIKFIIQKFLNYKNFSIYKSFNVDQFIFTSKSKIIIAQSEKIMLQILKKIKKKKDLLNIKIDNVLIGDLIYDTYLNQYKVPTLTNLHEKNFLKLLKKSLINFYFWKYYFNSNQVIALVVSDTVYTSSLLVRIAVKNKIPVYQCNWNNIIKIDNKNFYAANKFKFYREDFKKLPIEKKKIAIRIAKRRINQRFSGDKNSDDIMFYTKKTSFHSDLKQHNILLKNTKKKILIAAHCFLDAPHGYGHKGDLFLDFYEWLKYLYKISKKTNYDWYIKNHISFMDQTNIILANFLKDKPEFKLIPPETSHFQLIKEGINCVLTVHGTIGWEYAYFKIPVINASINNPHICYDFNLHPKSLNEYEKMILNFSKYKINYNRRDICEYYFMHNLFTNNTWMFDDYIRVMKNIGGYKNLGTFKFYNYWIDNYSRSIDAKINSKLNIFLASNEPYMKNWFYFK